MRKTSIYLKTIISLVIIFIFSYIGLWLFSANYLEKSLNEYSNKNSLTSYDQVKVTGFPFNLKAQIKNIKLHKDNLHPLLQKYEISANYINLETDLLFNRLKVNFPSESHQKLVYKDEEYNISSLSKGEYFLEIHDSNVINTHKIIYSIYENELDKDFNISKLIYKANDLKVINEDTKSELFNSNTDISISSNKRKDLFNDVDAKIHFDIQVAKDNNVISKFINIIFNKISIDIACNASFKKEDNASFETPSISLSALDLGLDESKFSLSGNLNTDEKDPQITFDLNLKLSEWKSLLDKLINNKVLSENQNNLILYLLQDIKGKAPLEKEMDIKIVRKKNKDATIGEIDSKSVSYYMQQIILGE